MQRAVLDEVVRFHIRLFRYGGRVVGNVHLDGVPIERLEGVVKVLMGGRMNPTTRSVRGGYVGLYILRIFLRAPLRGRGLCKIPKTVLTTTGAAICHCYVLRPLRHIDPHT
jgi:hypothetical protein